MSEIYTKTRKTMYLTLGLLNSLIPAYKTKLFILCYHSINSDGWAFSVKPDEFKKQITYLSTKYQFISLSDLLFYSTGKKEITKPSVVVTFDDGYKDVLQIVDFLKKMNVLPTMFLLSDTKNANRNELATQRQFLKKEEINILVKNGWELGSHTATHANMNGLTDKQIVDEIITSKKTLETQLNRKIDYLAYPKGRYNDKILSAVKKADYKIALTMDDGSIYPGIDLYKIPRIGVDGTHSFAEFKTLPSSFNIAARKILKRFL